MSAAGTFPAPNLRRGRHRVFAPGGPGVRASCLRSGGAGSRGPAGWMFPRACWRQLRQIDPRARPDSVAPAAARGSMESWPLPGRAARRAIGKHGACLRRALGPGARAGGVCVRVPRVPLPSPSGWASAGHSGANSAPLLGNEWSWPGWAGAGAGQPSSGPRRAVCASVSPSRERHTAMGDLRAPRVCSLSSSPFCPLSPLLRPAGPAWSRAGLGAGASDAEVVNMARPSCRRSQRAWGHECVPYLRPETLLSGLRRGPRRPHGRSVETRSLSGSLQSGKLRPGQAGHGCRLLESGGGQGALGSSTSPDRPTRRPRVSRHRRPRTSRTQRNPRLALRPGAAQAPPPPRGTGPRHRWEPPAPSWPERPPAPAGKEALTIKNVNVCVFHPQRSLLRRAAAADPGARGRFAEAPGWDPRRLQRGTLGAPPGAALAGVLAAGSADLEHSERPALGLGAQDAATEAERTGLSERPLCRRGDRDPAPPAPSVRRPRFWCVTLVGIRPGASPRPGAPLTCCLSEHTRALSARPGRGRGGRGSAPCP